MLALNLQPPGQPAAIARARRVEALAETALHNVDSYIEDGRLDGALTLVEAVLRDPDLPTDRPALKARLRVRHAVLLAAHAELGHVDLSAAHVARQVALDSTSAIGDEGVVLEIREALNQLPSLV